MNTSYTIRLPGCYTVVDKAERSALSPVCETTRNEFSDELLLAQVCDGNREALAVLFHRYARIVRGIVYRVLRNPSEADDLLQDIFLWLPRLSSTFDSAKGSARFWLCQVAYRRALCRRRYLTTRHFYKQLDLNDVAEELEDPQAGPDLLDETIHGIFGERAARQAFDALSENQRQTLRLYFVEGYTLEEIARKLGQAPGNVKHHYFRGLERLRKELFVMEQGEGIAAPDGRIRTTSGTAR